MSKAGKAAVAKAFAQHIDPSWVLGVGTGTTVDEVLKALVDRVSKEKISMKVVPTSRRTADTCRELGFTVIDPGAVERVDVGFDGADRVRLDTFEAIKGGGGALGDEGVMAQLAGRYHIIVDESKVTQKLGNDYAVPIEVDPDSYSIVARHLSKLGVRSFKLRPGGTIHDPVFTRRGNVIVDASFDEMTQDVSNRLKTIHGVVFVGFWPSEWTHEVWIGKDDGKVERKAK